MITVPNTIYKLFYNVLKVEFLKCLPLTRREVVRDTEHALWFEKVPNSLNKYIIEAEFSPINISPKYFYNKYREAENSNEAHPTIKEDVFIRACEKFIKLPHPIQLTNWADLKSNDKSAILLQVFVEFYSPTSFISFPQLNVFDRLQGKIRKSATLEKSTSTTLKDTAIDDGTFNSEKYLETLNVELIELHKATVKAEAKKFSDLLSEANYTEAFKMFSPNARDWNWNNNPLEFANTFYYTYAINVLTVSDVEVYSFSAERTTASCFFVYNQYVVVRTSEELSKVLLNEDKLFDIEVFYKNVKTFLTWAKNNGFEGVDNLPINSIFNDGMVDFIVNGIRSNQQRAKESLPEEIELHVMRLGYLEFSLEESTWIIEDFANWNTDRYYNVDHDLNREMRI